MKRLRRRAAPPEAGPAPAVRDHAGKSHAPKDPVRWGRRIYLVVLAVGALGIANYLVGDALFLRADGIVLSEQRVVAATYPARVAAVHVREGDRVERGAPLVRLESASILRDIAGLAVQTLDLATRRAEVDARQARVTALMPLAERREAEAKRTLQHVNALAAKGLASATRRDETLTAGFEATERAAGLRALAVMLAPEIELLERAHDRAAAALHQLEQFYAAGDVSAPSAGTVGSRIPAPGEVVNFGDRLMELHGTETHVLAYLPDIYVFGVEPGDRVVVSAGAAETGGEVETLLTVADALPPEFQNAFRPRDRSRLLRIRLDEGRAFAIGQKVRLRGAWWPWLRAAVPGARSFLTELRSSEAVAGWNTKLAGGPTEARRDQPIN